MSIVVFNHSTSLRLGPSHSSPFLGIRYPVRTRFRKGHLEIVLTLNLK